MNGRARERTKALPEPWVDLPPLMWRLDRHAPNYVRTTQTWRQALTSRGELVLVGPIAAWAANGCLLLQLRPSEGGHPIGGTIILVLALPLWLLMSLYAADALWDLIVGPYLRALNQMHDLYRGHSTLWIRSCLLAMAIVIELALLALLYWAPMLVAPVAFVAVFGIFLASLQWISFALLAPAVCILFAVRHTRSRRDRSWVEALNEEPNGVESRRIVIHHISDLHLFAAEQTRSGEGEALDPRGALSKVAEVLRSQSDGGGHEILVITGDITDTGAPSAWRDFLMWIPECGFRSDAVVFLPGNHDINVVTSDDLTLTDSRWANYQRWIRYLPAESDDRRLQDSNLLRCLLAMARHHADRAVCLDDNVGTIGLTTLLLTESDAINRYFNDRLELRTETYDDDHPDALRDEFGSIPIEMHDAGVIAPKERDVTDPRTRQILAMPRPLWDRAWPMLMTLDGPQCNVMLLNSTRLAASTMDNAFGKVGERQLDRALDLHRQAARPDYPTIVLLHHSLPPPRAHGSLAAPFLGLEDAALMVRKLAPLHPVYLSGHTHVHDTRQRRWRAAASVGYASDPPESLATHEIQVDERGIPCFRSYC